MLSIGMIGPPVLLQQNQNILSQQIIAPVQDICSFPLQNARQIAELDGLLITGRQPCDYARILCRLQQPLLARKDSLSIFGISAGASAFGKKQLLPLLNCRTSYEPCYRCTTSILDVPCFSISRFTAFFLPEVRFYEPGPSLGILCHHPRRGPVIMRQGDILVANYMAEWTPQKEIYTYWLNMVLALKNSREI